MAELRSVLSPVDVDWRGAENLDVTSQANREIVRSLPANTDDHTRGLLSLNNVQHTLEGEFFEVELVGNVKVCGDCFRVAVHHDHLVECPFQGKRHVDAAPVELDAGPYPVAARAEYKDPVLLNVRDVVTAPAVRHVEVVG